MSTEQYDEFHGAFRYSKTPRGYIYPKSLDEWAEAGASATTAGPDMMLFGSGNTVLRIWVEPCPIDERSSKKSPRYEVEEIHLKPRKWTESELKEVNRRKGYKTIYKGEDARLVARIVGGTEELIAVPDRTTGASEFVLKHMRSTYLKGRPGRPSSYVGTTSTYPAELDQLSILQADVTDRGVEIDHAIFVAGGVIMQLWAQPACVETRGQMGGEWFEPGDPEIESRYSLEVFTDDVNLKELTTEALLEWYRGEDRGDGAEDSDDWELVYTGEDPDLLVAEFERIAGGGEIDWRPSEVIPEDYYV